MFGEGRDNHICFLQFIVKPSLQRQPQITRRPISLRADRPVHIVFCLLHLAPLHFLLQTSVFLKIRYSPTDNFSLLIYLGHQESVPCTYKGAGIKALRTQKTELREDGVVLLTHAMVMI